MRAVRYAAANLLTRDDDVFLVTAVHPHHDNKDFTPGPAPHVLTPARLNPKPSARTARHGAHSFSVAAAAETPAQKGERVLAGLCTPATHHRLAHHLRPQVLNLRRVPLSHRQVLTPPIPPPPSPPPPPSQPPPCTRAVLTELRSAISST
jgi:hypothetical protein